MLGVTYVNRHLAKHYPQKHAFGKRMDIPRRRIYSSRQFWVCPLLGMQWDRVQILKCGICYRCLVKSSTKASAGSINPGKESLGPTTTALEIAKPHFHKQNEKHPNLPSNKDVYRPYHSFAEWKGTRETL